MLTYVSFSRLKIQFQENLLDLFLGRFVVVSSVGATIPSVCPPFLPQSASNSCKLSTKSFLMAAHHGCQLGLYTIIMQIATFPLEKIKFAGLCVNPGGKTNRERFEIAQMLSNLADVEIFVFVIILSNLLQRRI